jgi:hypothetical protein
MALIFCDSYDNYTNLAQKWSATTGRSSITSGGVPPRTGIQCLQLGGFGTDGPTENFVARTGLVVGFAMWPTAGGIMTCKFTAPSGLDPTQVHFDILPDLSFAAFRAGYPSDVLLAQSVPGLIDPSAWNYLECKVIIDAVNGSVVGRVNGLVVFSAFGINTIGNGNPLAPPLPSTCSGITLCGNPGGGLYNCYFDDTYMCDLTPPNGDFLGAVHIYAEVPFADTATDQWTPSVAGPHFPLVNTIPPNIAEYVESNTPGQVDEYLHAITGIPPASEVLAVQHSLLASVNTAGTQVIASSLNEITGPVNTAPSVTPHMALQPYDVDPATGAAWVLAEIPTRRIGPVVTA